MTKNDAISREQAKSDYADWYGYGYRDNTYYKHLCNMLPITLQPEIGHWINIDATHSKCDRCGAVFEIASENGEANYCPNCGANMEEVKK